MRIHEEHRIDFVSNATSASRDSAVFMKYAQNIIPIERAMYEIKQKNDFDVTREQILANVYWLGYGKVFERYHKITSEEFNLIKWMKS